MKSAKPILAVLGAAALAVPTSASPEGSRDAEANQAFTVYPKESLANGEQGVVHYRVKIDRLGRPKECEVTQSSGHRRLDLATCNMLLDNARFTPDQDRKGRPTRSSHEGRVVWKIS